MQVMAADSIGTSIRKRRQILGMKQGDLARAVGVSESTVSNWEQGKHFPLRYLGKIEAILGITLDTDEGAPPIPPELQEKLDELSPAEREDFINILDKLAPAERERVISVLTGRRGATAPRARRDRAG